MQTFREGDPKELMASLARQMNRDEFINFVSAALEQDEPEEFKSVWAHAPKQLRAVAYAPPPGVTVDVKALPEAERPAMYIKLNELRRQRCMPLSDPGQQHHWANENWVIMPMSKATEERFIC